MLAADAAPIAWPVAPTLAKSQLHLRWLPSLLGGMLKISIVVYLKAVHFWQRQIENWCTGKNFYDL